MPQYSDFLEITQEFMPVYTESGGRSLWRSFIPHAAFRAVLGGILDGLDSGRPPWIRGPYGTGKTFAAYTIKHILEDDADVVSDWLARQEFSDAERGRFMAARGRGRFVVVCHDAGSEENLRSSLLFHALQRKILAALAGGNLRDAAATSQLGILRERLRVVSWPDVFRMSRELFDDFSHPDEVLRELEGDPEPEVVAAVSQALLDAGVMVLQGAAEFRDWCRALVRANGLGGLIILCDEMTDFIRTNAHLKDLQDLAAHNAGGRFLFVPITHRAPGADGEGADEAAKIMDRFVPADFHMPMPTAFRLLRNCIGVRPGREDAWEKLRAARERGVSGLLSWLRERDDNGNMRVEGADELPRILPLHPLAAALLSRVSGAYRSSQRSLFGFVAARTGSEAPPPFQRFLAEDVDAEPRMLTADALLDFFFMAAGQEPEDLSGPARMILHQHRQRAGLLENPLSRRLHAAVTLLLILKTMPNALDWQAPRESVLRRCFAGAVSDQAFDDALAHLLEKRVVEVIDRDGDREFVGSAPDIDRNRLEAIREGIAARKFADLADRLGIGRLLPERFLPVDPGTLFQRRTAHVFCVYDELRSRRGNAVPSAEACAMVFVICVCLRDEDVAPMRDLCRELAEERPDAAFLALDTPFGPRRLDEACDLLARIDYFRERSNNEQREVSEQDCARLVARWMDCAAAGARLHAACLKTDAAGRDGDVKGAMRACLKARFPQGLWDEARMLTTLCDKGRAGPAAADAIFGDKAPAQYQPLQELLKHLGDHPDSAVFRIVRAIREKFEGADSVDLLEIWSMLSKPPYGLYESQVACVLLAHALRPLLDRWFHFDAKGRSNMLTRAQLKEVVASVVRGRSRPGEALRAMSAEDGEFCAFVRRLCGCGEDEASFPDEARRVLIRWFKGRGIALCLLGFLDAWQGENPNAGRLAEALHLLDAILNGEDAEGGLLRRDFVAKLGESRHLETSLRAVLDADACRRGLEAAVDRAAFPHLAAALEGNRVPADWLLQRLEEHLPREPHFWTGDDILGALPVIDAERHLQTALEDLIGEGATGTPREAIRALINRMGRDRSSPLCVFRQEALRAEFPALDDLLDILGRPDALPDARGAGTWDRVAGEIGNARDLLRDILWGRELVFCGWANQYLPEPMDPEDARDFVCGVREIDPLISKEDLARDLRAFLRNSAEHRASGDFSRAFTSVFNAANPAEWAERNGCLPLDMVLEGRERDILPLFDTKNRPTVAAYNEGVAILKECGEHLGELSNPRTAVARLVAGVAPEFSALAQGAGADELWERLQDPPDGGTWTPEGIAARIREWGLARYDERLRPALDAWTERASEDEMRGFLRLLAGNPGMGASILHHLMQAVGVDRLRELMRRS